MAQYHGAAIVPIAKVCADYFSHLTPQQFARKVYAGDIDLIMTRIENSQKTAMGVHLCDLAAYIDHRRKVAQRERDQLHGRD
jgi:hypothetical protein